MLPTLVDEAPESDAWHHEIKYDGYRTILSVDGAETRPFTRNGHDWTERYPRRARPAVPVGDPRRRDVRPERAWRHRLQVAQVRRSSARPGYLTIGKPVQT
jgi:hypothetical protein